MSHLHIERIPLPEFTSYSALSASYLNNVFQILYHDQSVIAGLENKLTPFITVTEGEAVQPLVTLHAVEESIGAEWIERIREQGEEVAIDNSLYLDLQSKGRRLNVETGYAILIEKTSTVCLFESGKEKITLFNEDMSLLSRDLQRLLKSLIMLQCEKQGHVVLHASGVKVGDGDGVLFLGDSRNGKTTILLEVLSKFSADMMSCDTSTLCLTEQGLVARGWPSNFSVSLGTVHDYPSLYPFFPTEKKELTYGQVWNIYDKDVLDSKQVVEQMGVRIDPQVQVKSLVCLNFDPAARTQIVPLTARDEVGAWIRKVYLGSLDFLYPNWHGYWTVSEEEIQRNIDQTLNYIMEHLEVYQMDWAPGPESLLKRVGMLEPHNINKQTLLKTEGVR